MGKRGRILIAIAAVAVLAVLVWAFLLAPSSASEPVYNGKPLSYWLHAYSLNANTPAEAEPKAAIHTIGTNAIPTLLRMLRAHDSPLKTKLLVWALRHHIPGIHYTDPMNLSSESMKGFDAIGRRAAVGAVPELIKILDENYSSWSRGFTASVLGNIGPEAEPAVPALLRATTSTNEFVCGEAFLALGKILADRDAVVPVLIKALQTSSPQIRWNAVYGLRHFHGDAKSAVPALVVLLNDPNLDSKIVAGSLRAQVEHVLMKIDPETYARVVTNATNAMQSPIPYK